MDGRMEFGLKLLDEHGFVKNKMISGCFGSRFPGQSRMVQISLSLSPLSILCSFGFRSLSSISFKG